VELWSGIISYTGHSQHGKYCRTLSAGFQTSIALLSPTSERTFNAGGTSKSIEFSSGIAMEYGVLEFDYISWRNHLEEPTMYDAEVQ